MSKPCSTCRWYSPEPTGDRCLNPATDPQKAGIRYLCAVVRDERQAGDKWRCGYDARFHEDRPLPSYAVEPK